MSNPPKLSNSAKPATIQTGKAMKNHVLSAVGATIVCLSVVFFWSFPSLAQEKAVPVLGLNAQKTSLTIKSPSTPSATYALDAAQVDNMIAELAQMRAEMKPPRPAVDPSPGTKINVATAGRWWVQKNGANIDLAVLHPGYGWVGIEMSPIAAEQLQRRLTALHPAPVRAKHYYRRR